MSGRLRRARRAALAEEGDQAVDTPPERHADDGVPLSRFSNSPNCWARGFPSVAFLRDVPLVGLRNSMRASRSRSNARSEATPSITVEAMYRPLRKHWG